MNRLLALLLAGFSTAALAQSSPGLYYGQVPTAIQWNSYFAAKQDALGYTATNKAGDTFTGKMLFAPATGLAASVNWQPGSTTPTTPTNGDMWASVTGGLIYQFSGVPLTLAGVAQGVTGVPTANQIAQWTAGNTLQGFTPGTGVVTALGVAANASGGMALVNGSPVSGDCLKWSASGAQDAGAGCGTPAAGTTASVQINNGSGAFAAPTTALVLGGANSATPSALLMSMPSVIAGTTNGAGSALTVQGSLSTGSGVGGSIVFKTSGSAASGTTQNAGVTVLTLNASATTSAVPGSTVASGALLSSSASGGVGYTTGSGAAVTQLTSRTTGVTINTPTGAITMFSAAGSATAATFTVTNSSVAATDTIILNQKSGTNLYVLLVTAVSAGSFNVTFYTTGGTATDAPVINYTVTKGSAN